MTRVSPENLGAAGRIPRLASLDALRGFDMLWIVGGREALLALFAIAGWDGLRETAQHQLEHAPWHGFRAWDLVFPLFLFLAGVSTAFSFDARRARGATRAQLAWHALRRGLLLVLLGAIYNGLLGFGPEEPRYASVLGRIGLAWMIAAWLSLWLDTRGRVVAALVVLGGYVLLMRFVPVPGVDDPAALVRGQNLADWVDQRVLPGRLHGGDHDPEGLFSTLPAIATALAGMLAGAWLRRADRSVEQRATGLAVAGLALLALGQALDLVHPINKRLWTSSFVLVCAGWSSLLLAAFHFAFDRSQRPSRLARGLAVIGAHSLVAYMAARFVDFDAIVRVGFARSLERGLLHEALVSLLALALLWSCLAIWHVRRTRRPGTPSNAS